MIEIKKVINPNRNGVCAGCNNREDFRIQIYPVKYNKRISLCFVCVLELLNKLTEVKKIVRLSSEGCHSDFQILNNEHTTGKFKPPYAAGEYKLSIGEDPGAGPSSDSWHKYV